jgi:hypothetical protein
MLRVTTLKNMYSPKRCAFKALREINYESIWIHTLNILLFCRCSASQCNNKHLQYAAQISPARAFFLSDKPFVASVKPFVASVKPFVAEACPPMSHASASNGLLDIETHMKNAPCNRPLNGTLHCLSRKVNFDKFRQGQNVLHKKRKT